MDGRVYVSVWTFLNKIHLPPSFQSPMIVYKPTTALYINTGTSFLNRAEASAAERVVTHLLQAGVIPAQIGVITPYQVGGWVRLGVVWRELIKGGCMHDRRAGWQSHTRVTQPITHHTDIHRASARTCSSTCSARARSARGSTR